MNDTNQQNAPDPRNVQLAQEFPLLWAAAKNADDREKLGLSVGPGDEEASRALREIWDARGAFRG